MRKVTFLIIFYMWDYYRYCIHNNWLYVNYPYMTESLSFCIFCSSLFISFVAFIIIALLFRKVLLVLLLLKEFVVSVLSIDIRKCGFSNSLLLPLKKTRECSNVLKHLSFHLVEAFQHIPLALLYLDENLTVALVDLPSSGIVDCCEILFDLFDHVHSLFLDILILLYLDIDPQQILGVLNRVNSTCCSISSCYLSMFILKKEKLILMRFLH